MSDNFFSQFGPQPNKADNFFAQFDTRTGAPANVRAVVGSVSRPQDRLATIRGYYPDAQPSGEDNFVFTDPQTKRPTLYNPPGFDLGDIPSLSREAAQMVGGAAAAAAPAVATAATAVPTAGGSVWPGIAATGGAYALGSQGAGELFDRTLDFLSPRTDTRSLPQRLADVAGGALVDSLGSKYLPMAGEYLRKGLTAAKNTVAGISAPEVLQAFKDIGASPSAGVVSGNRAIQGVENAVRKSPGGAGIMQTSDADLTDKLTSYAQDVASRFGDPQSTQGLGATIRDAAGKTVTRFKDRTGDLYDSAAKLISPDVTEIPQATLAFGNSLDSAAVSSELPATAGKVQNKAVADLMKSFTADVVGPDGAKPVSYQALKDLRSRVGKIMGTPQTYSDFDVAQLKGLYGALTKDMDTIAEKAGPDAAHANDLASRYFRYNMAKNIEPLQKMVDDKTDEQAANYALSGMKDGDSRLKLLRNNFIVKDPNTGRVNSDAWDTVAGSVLARMGQATSGAQNAAGDAFSPATFLTNWNKLSPEAKTTLFYGKEYAGLREPLDRLVKLSAAMKDAGAGSNTSNTVTALTSLGLIGAVGGGLMTGDFKGAAAGAATMAVAPNVAARLLTSPRFVSWLADSAKPGLSQNGFAAQLGRLIAIAKAEPDLRDEIDQYMSAMRGTK